MIAKIVGAENVIEPSRFAPTTPDSYGAKRADSPTRAWPSQRPEPNLFFSSNDRSRWATIRALVDDGTYVVGKRRNFRDTAPPYEDTGIIFENDYQSLDKVMNPATGEFYSSKPPLLATVLAGEYWVLKKLFGWSLVKDRWNVVCTILITVNVIPFALMLVYMARLIEQFGTTDFGRMFTFTATALGTFLMTFGHTLNNHSPAAYCTVFLIYPLLRVGSTESRGELWVSGFFAGLLATLELPAAVLSVALLMLMLYLRPVRTLCSYLPAVLLPVALLLICNYAALGKLLPAYSDFGGPWYDYPGSHWKKWELVKAGQFVPGLDFNQESTGMYAFHLSVGHHGWFSLTPVFLLALVGLSSQTVRSGGDAVKLLGRAIGPDDKVLSLKLVGCLTVVASATVFAFYLSRTQSYNYGGNTSGPRWLFWLIPLWCLGLLPAADWLAHRRWGRALAYVCLGVSVLSAYYPAWNPWRSPWILQLAERAGWLSYELPPAKPALSVPAGN